ncbi:MAG TPA: MFS transporter [Terriglobales bacterium]|nr:MFS transporter [Terriglobales bacterium]
MRFTGLWHDREFLKYWTASAISDVGSQITALALPLIGALTLGASAWEMGVLTAAGSLPIVVCGLFAGVVVDRLRRRPVLIVADVARAALLLTIPLASFLGALRIELLFAVAFLVGALSVMFDIAHLAFLPSLVAREHLVDGNSKLEVTAASAQVVGPGLGGALIGVVGAAFAVTLDAASFLVSAWLIRRTRASEAPRAAGTRTGIWQEIHEGLRAVFAQPILRALMACSATLNLFGKMFLAVYVLYMTRELGLGAMGVGFVLATGGLGSLAGAIVGAPACRRFGFGPVLIVSALMFGLTGLLVPLAVVFPRAAVALVIGAEFFQWMSILVYYVATISVRQAMTPDRLQGRVNATIRVIAGGMLPIGALLGGALGGVIGLPLTLVVAEIGSCLGVLWLVASPVRAVHALPSVQAA